MLTGTASTGMILLRETDPMFETPASDNLVYQNFTAILLGLPLLIIISTFYSSLEAVTSVPRALVLLLVILVYFVVLNVVLFTVIKKKNKKGK